MPLSLWRSGLAYSTGFVSMRIYRFTLNWSCKPLTMCPHFWNFSFCFFAALLMDYISWISTEKFTEKNFLKIQLLFNFYQISLIAFGFIWILLLISTCLGWVNLESTLLEIHQMKSWCGCYSSLQHLLPCLYFSTWLLQLWEKHSILLMKTGNDLH